MATRPPPPVPALVDDLVEEVLLRFPPDDPARLFRAALVCKGWRRILSDPRFRRKFRELHRAAPVLGFFYRRWTLEHFLPTASFRPRLRPPYAKKWRPVDARHGRVLVSPLLTEESLGVWCPVTGEVRVLPMPRFRYVHWSAAVLCAATAAGCDHLDCGCGPFLVVFVGTDEAKEVASVCVYSAEDSAWSELTSVQHSIIAIYCRPSVLVGNALYFTLELNAGILKHDLVTRGVSLIELPPGAEYKCYTALTTTEEGGLGFATTDDTRLLLWSREAGSGGDAEWVQSRVIELKALLPAKALLMQPEVVGFGLVDGVGVVLLRAASMLFTVDLKSSCVRKIGDSVPGCYVLPYVNFCTPALAAVTDQE